MAIAQDISGEILVKRPEKGLGGRFRAMLGWKRPHYSGTGVKAEAPASGSVARTALLERMKKGPTRPEERPKFDLDEYNAQVNANRKPPASMDDDPKFAAILEQIQGAVAEKDPDPKPPAP